MKLNRLLAASGTIAAIAASALFSAGAASAADGLDSVEYVSGIPNIGFGDDGSEFEPGWNAYTGDGSDFYEQVSTISGLQTTGSVLVMKGITPTTGFAAGADDSALSSGPDSRLVLAVTVAGSPFALPLVGTPQTDGSVSWASFFDGPADGSLVDLIAEIEAEEGVVTLVAYGFSTYSFDDGPIDDEVVATTTYLTFNGLTTMFTPQPVATVPTSVTLTQARTGAVFSSTGFLPGESVEVYLSGENVGGNVGNIVADAAGVVSYTLAIPDLAAGSYTLALVGSLPNFQLFEFAVVADPIVAAPAQLAATGSDLSTGVIAGGLLLLAGAGFALFATRRRLGNQA